MSTIIDDTSARQRRRNLTHELNRTVGVNLRAARTAAGISIARLAQEVKLSSAAVIGYEHGTRAAPAPTLMALATALGVSVSWLLGLSDDERYRAGYLDGWNGCRAAAFAQTAVLPEAGKAPAGLGAENGAAA